MNTMKPRPFRLMLMNYTALAVLIAGAGLSSCETVSSIAPGGSPGSAAPAPNVTFKTEPDIRVRIARQATQKKLSGPVKLMVRQAGTTGKNVLMRTPLTITSSSTGISVVDGGGANQAWPAGSDVEVVADEGTPAVPGSTPPPIRLDGARLPGFITIRPNWSDAANRFDVIATMPIESYLPGVVTGELLKDWPRQTNEAQAVAARTYALFERDRARSEGRAVDVESTTVDQVFGSATTPLASDAVRATRGMVLTHKGKLLRAYFSSQCGGRPASAANVWPDYPFNKVSPLQGQPRQSFCQKAPLYRWQVTRKDDDVTRRLRAWGRATHNKVADIGRLRSVEIAARNDADRPDRYRLMDERGDEYTLRAEELRMALNQPVPDLAPITKENRVHSGDLEAEVWANQVRFTGRGWGHGVGMCQWCAKGMGDLGMDWTSMVKTFYPGVEIVKAY